LDLELQFSIFTKSINMKKIIIYCTD